ncbi:MAG: hypothetical protein AAFX94_16915, partial [Myxococcota bacterium]
TWNRTTSTSLVESELVSFRFAQPTSVEQRRSVNHEIERIAKLGDSSFVAVGEFRDELVVSSFDTNDLSQRTGQVRFQNSRQHDQRTHAFSFRADEDGGGILGLPTVSVPENDTMVDAASRVTFVRVAMDQSLSLAGTLNAQSTPPTACEDSCVDWYGNSRPVFLAKRVFALLGNELVEGIESAGQVRELNRVAW